jgi:CHAT domain-containing protein/tetratricopeptide (TPR) repeat protein
LAVMALLLGIWLIPARAQEQPPELDAIYKRCLQLYKAGKFAEAVPVIEEYIGVARVKFGEQHPLYAGGLGALGTLYQALNREGEAEPLFKRALLIKEKALGPGHIEVADALNDLAELYRKQSRLPEAEPLYLRALSIVEAAGGPEHPAVGVVAGNLAELYRAQGRLAEARPIAQRSLAIREKAGVAPPSIDADAVDPAGLLSAVNQLYQAGKYPEAIPIAERYVQIIETRHGTESPEYALALNQLAWLLRVTNRIAEAEPLFRRALAINESSYGPDHPNVARALINLAQLLRDANRLGEAEPLVRRAVAINERSLGADHTDFAVSLSDLAGLLEVSDRFSEAEPLMRRALAIHEKSADPDHRFRVAVALSNLAELLRVTNRFSEAEPLYRRALAINEKSYGPDHPDVSLVLNNLALLLQATNRIAEAEPLFRRALAINESSYGPDHPNVARALINLAQLLHLANRLGEAELLVRRALAIDEKGLGPDHPNVAIALNDLALLLVVTNRLGEAEPLMRRALTINEKSFGPEHTSVANSLSSLAELLMLTNRHVEAEPLMRRALAIDEKRFGPAHLAVATRLNNLALLLKETNRFSEAEPLLRRALAIVEMQLGPEHPIVGTALNNLAELLRVTNRFSEAEPLYRRALAINEKSYGPDHPDVATRLNNLALLLQATDHLGEAERLFRRAQAIQEKGFGPDHPKVAIALTNLGWFFAGRGDWHNALASFRRADPVLIRRGNQASSDRTSSIKGALGGLGATDQFRGHIRAAFEVAASDPLMREESYQVGQRAISSEAAEALSQMATRFGTGTGQLAELVRKRQDLIALRQGIDKMLLGAIGGADAEAAESLQAKIRDFDTKLDAIDARLRTEFPDYFALINSEPLSIAATQGLLRANEVLVQFLDTWAVSKLSELSFVWAITKSDARWVSVPLGTRALSERIGALHCGLDRAAWEAESKSRCATLLAVDPAKVTNENAPLPFDLTRAHQLYQALFSQVEDLIKGKHLLIVPSGPLTQIPFHVLATEQPDPAATGAEALRRAAWLAKSNAITVLPSVSSLKALRENAKTSQAKKPFIGFGNPLLNGRDANDGLRVELARARQHCAQASSPRMARMTGRGMAMPQQRGGLVNVADIRTQVPLPETADELCAVARSLGVPESDVWLGARASEREVKWLSESGELAGYRILHFATHGALAGELKAGAEPGLILTPPEEATPEDDGYLSASEIAGLKLDADWVILSACNTAAGGTESAEALSGMSRAFFYAGARALLVSHWAVDSDATVKLITKTLTTMAADKTVGRSEALRRSMVALIDHGEPNEAHPGYWAPFVVVGEGATGIPARPSSGPAAASASTTAAAPVSQVVSPPPKPVAVEPSVPANAKKTTAARPRPKTKAVDWKKSIFER